MVKEASSLTGGKGVTVAPSPLNGVKLDLGVILSVGLVLLLVQGRVTDRLSLQLLLLLSYGVLGLLWIVLRARRIVAEIERQRQRAPDEP